MPKKRFRHIFTFAVLFFILTAGLGSRVSGWSNGGYSSDPAHPSYGTHDWIAQHALDWLPAQEKQFFTNNLASYLYGTELPDNSNTPDGVGDTTKHHVYFFANGSLQDDASAVRASQEYVNAQQALGRGNLSAVVEHLGMVTHYVSDVAVFGHVMGAATVWSAEQHHSDYEDHVLARTEAYSSGDFNVFLVFDGNLSATSAYDGAVSVARDTTFDGASGLTCTWMDQHYNWTNTQFKNRAGESLNLATNTVADVLHTFYAENIATTPSPTSTPTIPEFAGETAVLALILIAAAVLPLTMRQRFKRLTAVESLHLT